MRSHTSIRRVDLQPETAGEVPALYKKGAELTRRVDLNQDRQTWQQRSLGEVLGGLRHSVHNDAGCGEGDIGFLRGNLCRVL